MLRWTSIALGVVAATVAAKVLAQDTSQPASQPERRGEVRPKAHTVARPLAVAPSQVAQAQIPPASAEAQLPPGQLPPPQVLADDRTMSRAIDERPRRYDRGVGGYDARYARPAGPSRRAAPARSDWPLDQSRRFEGPRDAYGGRWIYVRPAARPRYRNRYAGRSGYGYDGGERQRRYAQHRYADANRPRERSSTEGPDFDRYPYNLGRRRDF